MVTIIIMLLLIIINICTYMHNGFLIVLYIFLLCEQLICYR